MQVPNEGIHQRQKKKPTKIQEPFKMPMTSDQFPRRTSWSKNVMWLLLLALLLALIYYLFFNKKTSTSWDYDGLPFRTKYKYF
jgi:hypothetical protein